MLNENKAFGKQKNRIKNVVLSAFLAVAGAVSAVILISLDDRNSHFVFPILFPFLLVNIISVLWADDFSQLFTGDIFFVLGLLTVLIAASKQHDTQEVLYGLLFFIIFYAVLLFTQIITLVFLQLIQGRHKKRLVTFSSDENGTVTVTDNLIFAKRLMIGTLVIIYTFSAFVCCFGLDMPRGDLSDVKIDISGSTAYSDEEVAQAASVLVDRFLNNCESKLYTLYYHSDDGKDPSLLAEYDKRHPEKNYTHIIIFSTDFVGLTDTGSTSAGDCFYWTWTIARSDNGKWEIVNYGW